MSLNEKKYDTKKENEPKREFAFSQEFPNEVELALKAFDRVFKELTSISNGKITFPEEYGVVNNLYKFRYITPTDVATYTSNLIKVLKNHMIHPHVDDLQKFAVVCAKQYVEDHGCVPIEHSSIYGLYNYTTDNMTLRDLLVLCENDFYHTTVVSKFEMQERVKVMKEDYKKIADMHFTTNIMKIVDSLPKLITHTDFLELTYVEQKAVQTFIEEFILFTIMLNTVIMSNMIFFCVPKSTYDTKFIEKKKDNVDSNTLLDEEEIDDDGLYTEAVDTSKTKPIYVVLTEGTEFVSDQVKRHTRSRYSHSGLSFDDSLHHVYSFGLQNPKNEDTIVRNGFRMDDMFSDHHKGIRFSVFVAFVSNDKWNTMKKYADHIKDNPKSKYSIGIIWRQLWNDNKPHKSDEKPGHELKEVCSTFVNSVLKSANIDLTKKVLPSPGDFEANMLIRMDQFNLVFSGTSDQLKIDEFRSRVKEFAERDKTKKLAKGDVITECCLLKTNTARHTSKIPFDINMRNIVLQDMHPKFKDTVAAIEYITHDSRSPFAQLIYRYGKPSEVLNGMDGMMICKMFINDPCARCSCYDEYNNKLHEVDFHTDVCWLDKIAFGNNFLDGDYRAEDSVGLQHKHPIKQTLETLYHMFGETRLKTKEELCNHILKIAHIMKGVIDCYGSNGLYNWELVRDILAVLGEIMTRSLIKLYNAHMILIVSDNMDDVDAPGYMYTEMFVLDEFVMEDGEHEPKVVDSNNGSGNKSASGNGSVTSAQAEQKKSWCKQMLDKFTKWVQSSMGKVAEKFKGNYKAQVDYVAANKKMNAQIKNDLQNGSFKPTVEDWPKYNIPIAELGKNKLSEVIKPWLDGSAKVPLTAVNVKKAFYPEAVANVITESYVFEFGQVKTMNPGANNAINMKGSNATAGQSIKAKANAALQSKIDTPKKYEPNSENGKKLQNYFLFGKPESSNDNYSNELTAELWEDTINNIVNCEKAITIGIKEIAADIKSTSDELKQRVANFNAKMDEAAANRDQAATDQLVGQQNEIARVEDLIKIVTEISNEYGIGFAGTMQDAFFVTSYKLYSEIIKKYKDVSGGFEQQQPSATANANAQKSAAATPQPAV